MKEKKILIFSFIKLSYKSFEDEYIIIFPRLAEIPKEYGHLNFKPFFCVKHKKGMDLAKSMCTSYEKLFKVKPTSSLSFFSVTPKKDTKIVKPRRNLRAFVYFAISG